VAEFVKAVNSFLRIKHLWESCFSRFPSCLWERVGILSFKFPHVSIRQRQMRQLSQPLIENIGHIRSLCQTVLFYKNVTGGQTKDVPNFLLYDEQKQ